MEKISIIFFISLSIMTINFLNAVAPWYDEAYASNIDVTLKSTAVIEKIGNPPKYYGSEQSAIWANRGNYQYLYIEWVHKINGNIVSQGAKVCNNGGNVGSPTSDCVISNSRTPPPNAFITESRTRGAACLSYLCLQKNLTNWAVAQA